MNFCIRDACLEDVNLLKDYKKHSIFDYAHNLSSEEEKKILDYIDNNLDVNNFHMIIINDSIVGAYSINLENNNLLEEIFIEEEYRNKGIASRVIESLIKEYKTLTLWVYKENKNAIRLYEKIGFIKDKDTESRYFMVYNK